MILDGLMNDPQPLQLRHQQGSKGILFWAGIVGNELVGPWRIADDAKNNSPAYIEFLRLNLQLWLKKKILEFKQKVGIYTQHYSSLYYYCYH